MSEPEDPRRVVPQRRRPRAGGWPLLLIVALAVGLRVMAWHNAVQMANDGVDFLWQARCLLEGDAWRALAHPYHPLYAALTALVALATGQVVTAALAVSVASGVLIVLATHLLSRLALPNRPDVAWAAALLAALHERTLILTSDIASDGLFLGLFLLSLAMIQAAEQTRRFPRQMLAAGTLAGLAYLARPEALFLAGVAVMWVVLGVVRRTARRGRPLPRPPRYLAGLLAFLVGLAAVGGPYVWAMHRLTGTWGLSLKPSMAAARLGGAPAWTPPEDAPIASPWIGAREDDEDLFRASRTEADPGAHAAPTGPADAAGPPRGSEPAEGPQPVPPTPASRAPDAPPQRPDSHQLVLDLRDGLLHSVAELFRAIRLDVLVLALLGLPLLLRRRSGLVAAMVVLMLAWVGVGTTQWVLSGYLARRHMLAPALLPLPLAGAGLVWLWGARRGPGALRLLGRVLVVLLRVAAGASGARTRHTNHAARVEALHWASEHTAPGERVGVHRRKDGHDAGRDVFLVSLPCHDAELLDAMERWNVRLLVMDLDRVEREAPHWLDGAPFEEQVRFGAGEDTVVVLERGSVGS